MWLEVARSNNNPEVPTESFLRCVPECGCCPVEVRGDCGTENGILRCNVNLEMLMRLDRLLQSKKSFCLVDQLL